MVQIAFIVPVKLLHMVKDEPLQFIIAPYCEMYPEYLEFYRSSTGYKIIDNGTWELEKPMEPERFLRIAKDVKASEIVLPDFEYKMHHTMARTREFVSVLSTAEKSQFKWQLPLQGDGYADLTHHGFDMLAEVKKMFNIEAIGVPLYNKDWVGRIAAVWYLKQFGLRDFHLLGTHDPIELAAYGPEVRSCDGRFAFKYGLAKIPWCMKYQLPVVHRFDMMVEPKHIETIKHNMLAWKLFAARNTEGVCEQK
jgi:hypothetical protein